jgi:hypothetical protein
LVSLIIRNFKQKTPKKREIKEKMKEFPESRPIKRVLKKSNQKESNKTKKSYQICKDESKIVSEKDSQYFYCLIPIDTSQSSRSIYATSSLAVTSP